MVCLGDAEEPRPRLGQRSQPLPLSWGVPASKGAAPSPEENESPSETVAAWVAGTNAAKMAIAPTNVASAECGARGGSGNCVNTFWAKPDCLTAAIL